MCLLRGFISALSADLLHARLVTSLLKKNSWAKLRLVNEVEKKFGDRTKLC